MAWRVSRALRRSQRRRGAGCGCASQSRLLCLPQRVPLPLGEAERLGFRDACQGLVRPLPLATAARGGTAVCRLRCLSRARCRWLGAPSEALRGGELAAAAEAVAHLLPVALPLGARPLHLAKACAAYRWCAPCFPRRSPRAGGPAGNRGDAGTSCCAAPALPRGTPTGTLVASGPLSVFMCVLASGRARVGIRAARTST